MIFNLCDEKIEGKLPLNYFTSIISHFGSAFDVLFHHEEKSCINTYIKDLKNKQCKIYKTLLQKTAMVKHNLKRKPPSFAPYINISENFANNMFDLGCDGCIYVLMNLNLFEFNEEDKKLITINVLH